MLKWKENQLDYKEGYYRMSKTRKIIKISSKMLALVTSR